MSYVQTVKVIQISPYELDILIESALTRVLSNYNDLKKEESVDKWMSIEDLCEYLPGKTCKPTVYGWVNKNKIPFHKTGKRLVFRQSEIDNWISSSIHFKLTE